MKTEIIILLSLSLSLISLLSFSFSPYLILPLSSPRFLYSFSCVSLRFQDYLLDSVLVLSDRNAVDKLDGRPQPVELGAFVHVHDSIGRGLRVPHWLVEEGLDALEDNFKDGQATAKPLPGQKIAVSGY